MSALARILQALEVPVLVAVPLVLGMCAFFQIDQSAFLTVAVTAIAILIFMARFETSKPDLFQIMPTVVLAALAAAGRILFAPVPDVKPVAAICIISGLVFGKRCGFMVGALAALVSNFFFGQGAWTPWQMYAWGLIGYVSGCLPSNVFERHPWALYVYGMLAALAYGFILNSWFIVGWVHPLTWEAALAAYGAGFVLDVVQGIATIVFLLVLYEPWRRKLMRIKKKYALV